jgi:ribosomal protein S18 acetylase RimI-like enzyme
VTLTVRHAVHDDWKALAQLRWDFRTEHGTPASMSLERFTEEFRDFADDALGHDAPWRVWVADEGGRLVGCVWMQLVEKVPHPGRRRWERPIGYVTNMYVRPDRRDSGLGRRLIDEALAFAAERDADGVVVWPSERSIPFYERTGFGTPGAPLWLDIAGD